jgi:hypothetical protein
MDLLAREAAANAGPEDPQPMEVFEGDARTPWRTIS